MVRVWCIQLDDKCRLIWHRDKCGPSQNLLFSCFFSVSLARLARDGETLLYFRLRQGQRIPSSGLVGGVGMGMGMSMSVSMCPPLPEPTQSRTIRQRFLVTLLHCLFDFVVQHGGGACCQGTMSTSSSSTSSTP